MYRTCGILLPLSSIASPYGIGCLSKEAYEFVDFLAEAGQSYWQMLPFGQTGFGDSPYQSVSAFAGNPYFIDPGTLVQDGLLREEECRSFDFGSNPERVDYGKLYENRGKLLAIANRRFREQKRNEGEEYRTFREKTQDWLPDYALFLAYKMSVGGRSWQEWEDDVKFRKPAVLGRLREELKDQIELYHFEQFEFQRQWTALLDYAHGKNVKIIGDLPYYVSLDSADAWSHPEAFRFDEELKPTEVAGCPPDAFSPTGQMWGNPIYNWEAMKKDGYQWWISRIARNLEMVDVIRIDHFNGFEGYWTIPADAKTAAEGKKEKGPGMDFFRAMKKELGDIPIIAEDLGVVTKGTKKLLEDSGYPGMNVLQYAFDWSEYSYYMTFNHKKNSVVYTGTHDNKTALQWISEASDHDRDLARRFIHSENTDYGTFVWDFIREAYRSPADLCIVPLQDYLVKGAEARINTPGTQGSNWQWRLPAHYLSHELAKSIFGLAKLYCRLPKTEADLHAHEALD